MKMELNGFTLKANFRGDKLAPWNNGNNWNNSRITVMYDGKRTGFDFWGSIMNPEIKTEYDLGNAFRCFVDDAISGDMTFEDFCSEFGYDDDSRKAEKVWRACKCATKKLERIYDGDMYDLINALEDYS